MKLDLDWMEKVVAFKSLVDEEYLSTIIDHVKPTYFGDKNLSFIFDVICDFYDRRKTLPTPTEIKLYLSTQEQRETFRKVVTELSAIEKNLNKDELYANTERFIKERGIYHAMMSVAKDVGNGEIDTGKILDMFEETCNVSLIHDIGTDLFNDMHKVREDVLQKSPTISTGYKWLDDKMGGGFMQNGRAMYVFAGETNIGKSIILGNFAINAARQGKTVLVITLEMSEAMYSKRLVASISQTSFANMAGDIDIVEAKVEGFKNVTGGRIIIKEFPPSCMTPRDIQAFIKKLKKNGINIELIVLDYINLLTSTKGKDSYERVKFIAEETRAITYEFKCPLVTVTQLNRCLALDTKVLTEDKKQCNLNELKVGDKIYADNANVVEVRHIYPIEKNKCYKIRLKSGKEIVCSSRHIFPTANQQMKSIDTGLKIGDKLLSLYVSL